MSTTDDRPVVIRDEPADRRAEQVPPQDLPAERSILGAMLLSKDAIADVVEVMRAEHFYRPAHQGIYRTQRSTGPKVPGWQWARWGGRGSEGSPP